MLRAIIDDELCDIDPLRDLDFMVTFECDGVRYQRRLGDCDLAHIEALREAMKSRDAGDE
jgi:hypothetical protein